MCIRDRSGDALSACSAWSGDGRCGPLRLSPWRKLLLERRLYGTVEFLYLIHISKIGSQRWAELAGVREEERVSKYPSMEEAMPEIYKELDALQTKLENHYKDMQDMESVSYTHLCLY